MNIRTGEIRPTDIDSVGAYTVAGIMLASTAVIAAVFAVEATAVASALSLRASAIVATAPRAAVIAPPAGTSVTQIIGNAQQTKKAGVFTTHGSTSVRIATDMAKTGEFVTIHLNQAIKTITGGQQFSLVRPDVAGVKPNGLVDAVEVLSPGQTVEEMTNKLTTALGNSRGAITCVNPDLC